MRIFWDKYLSVCGIGCVCGAVLVTAANKLGFDRAANHTASDIILRLERIEETARKNRPGLVFVRTIFDQELSYTPHEFDVADVLQDEQDGAYVMWGTITAGDASGSPPNNVLMGRLQFAEVFVRKADTQIDCFLKSQQLMSANGQGLILDNSNSRIIATLSGTRRVKMTLWRCVEEQFFE